MLFLCKNFLKKFMKTLAICVNIVYTIYRNKDGGKDRKE